MATAPWARLTKAAPEKDLGRQRLGLAAPPNVLGPDWPSRELQNEPGLTGAIGRARGTADPVSVLPTKVTSPLDDGVWQSDRPANGSVSRAAVSTAADS